MLRLLGFFFLAVLLRSFLVHVPVIGPIFARSGWLGLWMTAMLLSFAFTKLGRRAYRVQRDQGEIRRLLAVDSAHAHGKVGALLVAQGRARRAIPHLERAVEGEGEVAEWHYRLGSALLSTGRVEGAIEELRTSLELDPERGYGSARMRLVEALQRVGRHGDALDEVAVFDRNHGPSPESAYRRGRALRELGRKEEARLSFEEVGKLARETARYQRGGASVWVFRASLARMF